MIRLGILGWPVEHSRSPALHGAVHAELGIDASYQRLAVAPDHLAAVLRGLPSLAWTGCNVTVPHKVGALSACTVVTPEARLVGAVNTLHWTDGELVGDNTDARGWLASLHQETDWEPGQAAVLFGTGGAARAVAVALGRDGAEVVVVGRRQEAARAVVEVARAAGAVARGLMLDQASLVRSAVSEAAMVVNATPLGMHGERLPEPLLGLRRSQIAADLVYAPAVTPFLQHAIDLGATPLGGIGMLVHQAALSSARWHGIAPPVDAFRRAALQGGRPS